MEVSRHNRVSPWEIEPSGIVSGHSSLVTLGTKRTRTGLLTTKPEHSVARGLCHPLYCFVVYKYLTKEDLMNPCHVQMQQEYQNMEI